LGFVDLSGLIERWLDVIDMWESIIDDYQRAMQQVLFKINFNCRWIGQSSRRLRGGKCGE
jgi:hypothetical protein